MKVKCSKCRGTGLTPLPQSLTGAFRVVRGAGEEGVALGEVAERLGLSLSLAGYRLRELERLGVVRHPSKNGRYVLSKEAANAEEAAA